MSSKVCFRVMDTARQDTIISEQKFDAKDFPDSTTFVNTAVEYFGTWSIQDKASVGYQRDLQPIRAFFANTTTALNLEVINQKNRLYTVLKSGDLGSFKIPAADIPTQICPDSRTKIDVVASNLITGKRHTVDLKDPMVIAALNCMSFTFIADGSPGGGGGN